MQECAESYDSARSLLERFSHEMTKIRTEGLDTQFGRCYVKFIFVADYKFMLMALGMKAANCRNACLFCEQTNVSYCYGGLTWRKRLDPKAPGFKNKTIMPCFSLMDLALDTMHLFFRVTDKLFDLLVKQEIDDASKLAMFDRAGKNV